MIIDTPPVYVHFMQGYYPQFHGIVSDWMMDYKTGEQFEPRVNPDGPGSKDAGWFHDESVGFSQFSYSFKTLSTRQA